MKKRICVLLGMMMLTLSACNSSVNVDVTQPDPAQETEAVSDSDEQASTSAQETEEVSGNDEQVTAPAEDTQQEEDKLPLFKYVRKYYNERYSGKNKTDGDGNDLTGKEVYQGKSETLMVADESKDLYPELYKNLNEAAEEEIRSFEENANSQMSAASDDADSSFDDGRPFIGPFSDFTSVSVQRSDKAVLSFTEDFSNFTGGAHGMYGRTGITYDVQTGKKLSLTDVVDTTADKLIPVIKDEILKQNDPEDYPDLDENLANYDMDSLIWYLTFEGVHFYFAPYEIAAYAIGETDIVIGYDDLPAAVDEKYIPDTDAARIESISLDMLSNNGQYNPDKDLLYFAFDTEMDGYDETGWIDCTSLSLKQGDRSATAEEYFSYNPSYNTCKQYKITTKDKKEYIYFVAPTYNDYTEIIVFDVTDGNIANPGCFECHLIYADTDTDYSGEFVLTDPDNMYFGQVGDMLGTYICYGRYAVGSDGLPQFMDRDYTLSWNPDGVKSTKEIEVTVLDKDHEEQGTKSLPAGTVYKPVRTDNESYIDCELDDGSLVRLKYSSSDFPAQINGEAVDDLFENLMYAG